MPSVGTENLNEPQCPFTFVAGFALSSREMLGPPIWCFCSDRTKCRPSRSKVGTHCFMASGGKANSPMMRCKLGRNTGILAQCNPWAGGTSETLSDALVHALDWAGNRTHHGWCRILGQRFINLPAFHFMKGDQACCVPNIE